METEDSEYERLTDDAEEDNEALVIVVDDRGSSSSSSSSSSSLCKDVDSAIDPPSKWDSAGRSTDDRREDGGEETEDEDEDRRQFIIGCRLDTQAPNEEASSCNPKTTMSGEDKNSSHPVAGDRSTGDDSTGPVMSRSDASDQFPLLFQERIRKRPMSSIIKALPAVVDLRSKGQIYRTKSIRPTAGEPAVDAGEEGRRVARSDGAEAAMTTKCLTGEDCETEERRKDGTSGMDDMGQVEDDDKVEEVKRKKCVVDLRSPSFSIDEILKPEFGSIRIRGSKMETMDDRMKKYFLSGLMKNQQHHEQQTSCSLRPLSPLPPPPPPPPAPPPPPPLLHHSHHNHLHHHQNLLSFSADSSDFISSQATPAISSYGNGVGLIVNRYGTNLLHSMYFSNASDSDSRKLRLLRSASLRFHGGNTNSSSGNDGGGVGGYNAMAIRRKEADCFDMTFYPRRKEQSKQKQKQAQKQTQNQKQQDHQLHNFHLNKNTRSNKHPTQHFGPSSGDATDPSVQQDEGAQGAAHRRHVAAASSISSSSSSSSSSSVHSRQAGHHQRDSGSTSDRSYASSPCSPAAEDALSSCRESSTSSSPSSSSTIHADKATARRSGGGGGGGGSGGETRAGKGDLTSSMPWPAWVYCTRYSDRPSSGPRCRKNKKKERSADEKRPRTAFTNEQLSRLKREFEDNKYLTEERRQSLAGELALNESQIKIWFQNKRAKMKKASGVRNTLALQLMAQGLYNHSSVTVLSR